MLRQIVGFEIIVTKIEGKFKLSQNRTREDQANVIVRREGAGLVVSGVAGMMKDQGFGKFCREVRGMRKREIQWHKKRSVIRRVRAGGAGPAPGGCVIR